MKTVTRSEYASFIVSLKGNVKDTPIETINRSVMQTTVDGNLVAQAIYVKGAAPEYHIAD